VHREYEERIKQLDAQKQKGLEEQLKFDRQRKNIGVC
jgi:hypothetical protein